MGMTQPCRKPAYELLSAPDQWRVQLSHLHPKETQCTLGHSDTHWPSSAHVVGWDGQVTISPLSPRCVAQHRPPLLTSVHWDSPCLICPAAHLPLLSLPWRALWASSNILIRLVNISNTHHSDSFYVSVGSRLCHSATYTSSWEVAYVIFELILIIDVEIKKYCDCQWSHYREKLALLSESSLAKLEVCVAWELVIQ